MREGFTVHIGPGPARVVVEPPAGPASFVGTAGRAGCRAVLMGRLYYRAEHVARVRARRPDLAPGPGDPDAAVALSAYLALGADALRELEGDFAVAVVDDANRRVVAARDPMGGFPLFWAARGGSIAVGTNAGPLLDHAGRRAVDWEYVADFLGMYGQWGEGLGERCADAGLTRVPPGAVVVFDAGRSPPRRGPAWDWVARAAAAAVPADPRDLADAYRGLLTEAVRQRVRGASLCHVSGGMDSTSVALLAAELAERGAAPGPVHTLSLVYDRLPKLARERPYVEAALAAAGGRPWTPHRLPADDLLNYDGLADLPDLDEPYAGLWCMDAARAMTAATAAAGAAVMLTGLGADEVLDVQPFHLAGLARRGRLLAAWREANRWAAAERRGTWSVLGAYALTPLGWRGLRAGCGRGSLAGRGGADVPAWVRPGFARRFHLADRIRAGVAGAYRRHPDPTLSVALFALAHRAGDPVRWSLAAPRGIAMAHPFLDTRVVALGLGVLARSRPEPGRMKPLLAAAMGDRLPPAIGRRRAKSHFDELYYLGLARNRAALEALIDAAPPEAQEVFDPAALRAALGEAALAGPDARDVQRLDLTFSLLHWLRRRGKSNS